MKFINDIFDRKQCYSGFEIVYPSRYTFAFCDDDFRSNCLSSIENNLVDQAKGFHGKLHNLLMKGYKNFEMSLVSREYAALSNGEFSRTSLKKYMFYEMLRMDLDTAESVLLELLDYTPIVPIFKNEEGYNNEGGTLFGYVSLYLFESGTMDEKIDYLRNHNFLYFKE